jgi:tetratricopeptide (TPR) repeat protein
MVWFARGYWGTVPSRESMLQAKSLVLQAIEIDDTLEEAHDALARVFFFYDWDWEGAEREFKHAIQLNPNKADVRLFYSSFLRSMNRGDEAMSEAVLGLELDPLSSFTQCHYVGQLMFMHQYDEAILLLQKIFKQESGFPFLHRYLWICYQQKQMYDDAIEHAKNFFAAMGKNEFSDTIIAGYANSDYEEAMGLLASKMEKHAQNAYVQPVWIARLYAYARDNANALIWLEKAYNERDLLMPNLNTSTDWENLREEKGFKDLIKRMNFPS